MSTQRVRAMGFLSTSTRIHLRSLVRPANHIPRIPPRSTSISTGRPRAPPFFSVPPARRNFEHTVEPQARLIAGKDKNKNNLNPDPNPKSMSNPNPERARSKIERRPTNRQIPFDHVFVLDPETNKLSPTKHSLEELLETRRKQGCVIELVASTPEPIVRVTTRSEVDARYRGMKRALRMGARVGEQPKEVQLTWGVARADLEHKLRKAKRDLEKGYRVVVAVTMKNGHRPSNRRELVAFADEISKALCGVGEEWKEREFTERSMVLSFRRTELVEDGIVL